jgi:hypothetical protein
VQSCSVATSPECSFGSQPRPPLSGSGDRHVGRPGGAVAGDHLVARDRSATGQRLAPATKVDTL